MQVFDWETDTQHIASSPNIFAPFDLAGNPIFVTISLSMERGSEAEMDAERKDET
jgi:hypothetical protein